MKMSIVIKNCTVFMRYDITLTYRLWDTKEEKDTATMHIAKGSRARVLAFNRECQQTPTNSSHFVAHNTENAFSAVVCVATPRNVECTRGQWTGNATFGGLRRVTMMCLILIFWNQLHSPQLQITRTCCFSFRQQEVNVNSCCCGMVRSNI